MTELSMSAPSPISSVAPYPYRANELASEAMLLRMKRRLNAGRDGVLALDPRQVVGGVERRQALAHGTSVRILQRIERRLEQSGSGDARKRLAEARVSEIENVDQIRSQDRRVLRGNALAVVSQRRGGLLSGKLRQNLIVGIVGQRAANAHGVLAGGIDMEIDLAHDRPVVAMAGRVEAEAAEVEPAVLAESGVIANADMHSRP